jgi:hypothetical protein
MRTLIRGVPLFLFLLGWYLSPGCGGGSNGSPKANPIVAPMAPSLLEATPRSHCEIDLQWKDHSTNEQGFKIERSENGSHFFEIDSVPQNVSAYSDEGLVANTLYHYRVLAYNQAGQSDYSNHAQASTPILPWAKSYGGSEWDFASSILKTPDNGYLAAGSAASFGAGLDDYWILKLDPWGNIIWQKAFGGPGSDRALSLASTLDGGAVVAGATTSFGFGSDDFWLLKLNPNGTLAWQKTYGALHDEAAYSIAPTVQEGFIVAGSTSSIGAGDSDYWILKLNPHGEVEWQYAYGGSDSDIACSIQQTEENGYIVAGRSASFSADTLSDAWVLKLDTKGTVVWEKAYDGGGHESAEAMAQTQDNGFILAGSIKSASGGGKSLWLIKCSSHGAIDWQRSYGGIAGGPPCTIQATSIFQTEDRGYMVSGSLYPHAHNFDCWVLKLDPGGQVEWEMAYDGSSHDNASVVSPACDAGFVVAGSKKSLDVSDHDYWILKLNPNGTIGFNPDSGASARDTFVQIAKTWATSKSTLATVTPTEVIPMDTQAVVEDTHCTVEQQTP